MDLSKLTYSKEDSARTPADVPLHKATTENKDGSGMSETIQVPLAYRKTEGVFFNEPYIRAFWRCETGKGFSSGTDTAA